MNDLQIAFQYAQNTRPDSFPEYELFVQLLQCGFSVIRYSAARYCPCTDASLPGWDRSIVAAFACREAAIRHWEQHQDRFENSDFDEEYELLHPHDENRYADSSPAIGVICDSVGNVLSTFVEFKPANFEVAALNIPQPNDSNPNDICF